MKSVALLACLALSACAAIPREHSMPQSPSTSWRQVATSNDRTRLRDWRTAFNRALAQARAAGHAAEIAREGALLVPDAALGPAPIPSGRYKCRVIKVGSQGAPLLDYVSYPAFDCVIGQAGRLQSFTKLTGSQRQVGLIYPDGALRQVFLGSLVLGDEARAMQYGGDPDRDLAGWVERVGSDRWRLILPYPRYESLIDVVELVPAR